MEAVDYEEIFKDSIPYNIYKELDDQVKDVTDDQHCIEFKGINSPHKEKYVTLCKKVSKLLDIVFKKESSENYEDYCLHYRYWVYHELRKLFKDDKKSNDITEVINKFNKLQTTIFSKYAKRGCSFGFVTKDYKELNYKIEEKYLYDYFKNYNTIKSSKQCSNVGSSKYRAYLEAIKKLYDVEYNFCCWTGLTECPDYILTCDNKFDPSKLLSALGSEEKGNCDGLKTITSEEIFKDSIPYNIYKELDDQVKDVTDDQHCTEFKGINSPHKEKYVTLCKKVSKLLDIVFKKESSKNYEDYCSHYRYWVYHELRKLFKDDKKSNDITEVINKFNKLQTTIFSKYAKRGCSFGFVTKDYKELNYKIEEKYLYDYFKNYNTIKSSKQCSNVGSSKYRAYLEAIKKLYDVEYNFCCWTGLTECPDYILTCDNKFDPSKLLSALGSEEKGNCDGLKTITSVFNDKKSDSEEFKKEFMSAIKYGVCYSPKKDTLEVEGNKRPVCILYSKFDSLPDDEPTARSDGTEETVSMPSADNADSISRADPGKDVQSYEKGNGGNPSATDVKKKIPSSKLTLNPYKWSFKSEGKLDCRSRSKNKDSIRLCGYMDELVEGNFATQIEGTGGYKVKAGRKWTDDDLKSIREKVRKRRSANESNILNNIFVRISTAVTLFTPFGSRLRRNRKRKQRYRFDFTDLYTRKRTRRFLKRTYRHSDRRRFNVVNIEDEFHS
ncbi:PIR Superfamily Protein [Plasmodium malariae]|uniref:PIR Superfamily Protein n=1 Tax=Plasmodium malariae TaxID=5858 RepID=A0A1A8WN99_PLAMA|nr:PIR Superfamily Protein [Plasmodium malariae]